MLDVAQREQARAARLQDLSRQRVDAGLDNQLQLRQSESTIAAARQQAQAAQQQIDALHNALAALLGKGPDRGLDITRPRLLDAPSPGVPAVLPSELPGHRADRSEEHTSELQSLMRISYAVFCLKKKK